MPTPHPPQRAWVAIQRNRTSGAGGQYGPLRELIDELRGLNFRPRLFSRREELDAAVAAASGDPPTALVAAGGDGTVLDLLNRHPRLPLAILPLGTENLLARHFGIPRRGGRFVARMIAAGRTQTIDLGAAGPRRFAIMASCGFDAAVLHAAHAARTGHIGRRHYIPRIATTFLAYEFPPLRVYLDDDPAPQTCGLAVVANLPRYAVGLPFAPHADPTDGRLDVRLLPHRSKFQLLRDLGTLLCRSRESNAAVCRRASRVRIEADGPVPVQVDGDPAGTTPVEISVLPAAARLIVPGGGAQGVGG